MIFWCYSCFPKSLIHKSSGFLKVRHAAAIVIGPCVCDVVLALDEAIYSASFMKGAGSRAGNKTGPTPPGLKHGQASNLGAGVVPTALRACDWLSHSCNSGRVSSYKILKGLTNVYIYIIYYNIYNRASFGWWRDSPQVSSAFQASARTPWPSVTSLGVSLVSLHLSLHISSLLNAQTESPNIKFKVLLHPCLHDSFCSAMANMLQRPRFKWRHMTCM